MKSGNGRKGFFQLDAGLKILTKLRKDEIVSASEIGKRTNITYSHIHRLIIDAEKRGLITIQHEGRNLCIKLTDRGDEAVCLLIQIQKILKKDEAKSL